MSIQSNDQVTIESKFDDALENFIVLGLILIFSMFLFIGVSLMFSSLAGISFQQGTWATIGLLSFVFCAWLQKAISRPSYAKFKK